MHSNQSINQSSNQSINQSINQSVSQSVSQSVNQSITDEDSRNEIGESQSRALFLTRGKGTNDDDNNDDDDDHDDDDDYDDDDNKRQLNYDELASHLGRAINTLSHLMPQGKARRPRR